MTINFNIFYIFNQNYFLENKNDRYLGTEEVRVN
jgi:hypothetical protein